MARPTVDCERCNLEYDVDFAGEPLTDWPYTCDECGGYVPAWHEAYPDKTLPVRHKEYYGRHEHGEASLHDNRDSTVERVVAVGRSVGEARATAFMRASEEAQKRNKREGWFRFVPVKH